MLAEVVDVGRAHLRCAIPTTTTTTTPLQQLPNSCAT